jgi:tRNA(Ile)-lysidine synthase
VSGGADSVLMLYLFLKLGYNCGIAHCNFKLRGSDSDLDEELVSRLAKEYGYPLHKICFETKEYAASKGISIEMAARDLRYTWFEDIKLKFGYQYIATAHHQDDLIETFFINLARGTGIRGLCGFGYTSGHIIRPMLFTKRETIMEFVAKEGLEYRDDQSNFDTNIIRNKLRHSILPLFNEINPSSKQNILQTIDNLKDAELLMQRELEKASCDLINRINNRIFVDSHRLLEYPHPDLYLFELIKEFGFNRHHASQIYDSLTHVTGKIFYSNTHRLFRDREKLVVVPLGQVLQKEISISGWDKPVALDSGKMLQFECFERKGDFKIPKESDVAAIDFEQLKFPLKLRRWEQGDYFFPLGMDEKKKISDFLIDQKVDLSEKQDILLLLSENKVVWVVGKRIDNRFRITSMSNKILRICLTQIK